MVTMKKLYWPWIAGLFLLGACTGSAAAAEETGMNLEVIAPGGSDIDLRGELFNYYGTPEEPVTAVSFSPEFTVSAGNMKYDRREEVLSAAGGVLLYAEEMELRAEEIKFYLKREEFEAGGGFALTTGEMDLTGCMLKGCIAGGTLTATVKVGWRFREVEGEAEKLVYRQNEEKVYLSGKPVVRWEQGSMEGNEVIVNLETGEITMTGPVKSKLQP